MTIDLERWDRHVVLRDGRAIHIRPIRSDDERFYEAFFHAEDAEDLRFRFFESVKSREPAFFASFTHIDYDRAMAFIALDEADHEMLGVVRLHDDPHVDGEAEFAIIVRSDLKSHGLGWLLMHMIIAYARAKGLREIEGEVLYENVAMLDMCKKLGFVITSEPGASYIASVRLPLLHRQGDERLQRCIC